MRKLLVLLMITASMAVAQDVKHCKGIKSNGEPCKSTILLKDGYCIHHSPSVKRCGFIKKDGTPCKNASTEPNGGCVYHWTKMDKVH